MRIASLNLGRRLRSLLRSGVLDSWLEDHAIDVLLAQDPFPPSRLPVPSPTGFFSLGGSERVHAWARSSLSIGPAERVSDYSQMVPIGYLSAFNVYLDASRQRTRAQQLAGIARRLKHRTASPCLVVGDFNLAPTESDGLVDGRISKFNGLTDRKAYRELVEGAQLRDMAASCDHAGFTREVTIAGRSLQFRCDLALLSRYCLDQFVLEYDHGTRAGTGAFTDHSALIIGVPISVDGRTRAPHVRPGNTAKARVGPSWVARHIVPSLVSLTRSTSILDFGCGRGRDVAHYRELGFAAEGYDTHTPHGFFALPRHRFDLVCMTYVLNTLPHPGLRLEAVQSAARMVRSGGHLVVSTRLPQDILYDSHMRRWEVYNDGYCTSRLRGTFVKGMSREEVSSLIGEVGLQEVAVGELPEPRGAFVIVATRRPRPPSQVRD